MFRRWTEGTLQSVLAAAIIGLIPGAVVTYFARMQSVWTLPLLLGLTGTALTVIILLALDAIRRLPPRRVIPTLSNIESCVRDWLNNFQCSVKKAPTEATYFRYLVTVDSGTKILIGRTKGDFQDYIQIRADLITGDGDMARFNELSEMERAVVIGNIRLELARRNVGYRNLSLPAEDTNVFKRVPIRESLTEHEFISALDEVEAAVHAAELVFALEIVKAGKFPQQEGQKALEAQQ